ncbi:hypothetical protein ACFE04_002138 [Oxalis oulophora]
MNPLQKIDCQDRIHHQANGLVRALDSQFTNQSSSLYLTDRQQQDWNMEITNMHSQQGSEPGNNSSAIIGRFESPASAFYATERYMGFPQYENNDALFNSYQSLVEKFSTEQADTNFELRNFTLQPTVRTNSNQLSRSSERPEGIFSVSTFSQVPYNSYSSPPANMTFSGLQKKRFSCRDSFSGVPVQSSKTRIRWTQDLHDKFVECVTLLGGAEKATPKGILKLMGSHGLTIFHVKSHLQKYRTAKYMPDPTEGKSDRGANAISNDLSQFDVKTGLQIKEALQMQLDVQRSLHEQLEIQRTLQLRIEEQGKQLKKMFEEQQKKTNNLLQSHNLPSNSNPTSFSTRLTDISTPEEGSDNNTLRTGALGCCWRGSPRSLPRYIVVSSFFVGIRESNPDLMILKAPSAGFEEFLSGCNTSDSFLNSFLMSLKSVNFGSLLVIPNMSYQFFSFSICICTV